MNEAASNCENTPARVVELERMLAEKSTTIESLEQQLDWFKRQLFGRKSEKRVLEDNPHQPLLDGFACDEKPEAPAPGDCQAISYTRKKHRRGDCVNDSGLRFDASVPVKTIHCSAPELDGAQGDEYEIIREERTYRLAQRRSSYVVLEYVRPVLKRRGTGTLITTPAPASIFPGTLADVSVIGGLVVDKLVYHQPLYRQHQRMGREGVTVARTTLTNLMHKAATVLTPIAKAQLHNILQSKVLAIDETPIKAGREKKGRMRLAWYWPIYGDNDEVYFSYSRSRGRQHLLDTLGHYTGTIVSDGHSAYASYAKRIPQLRHAQCWTHTRREFVKAERSEPEAVAQALDYIGALFHVEGHIRDHKLSGEAALKCRAEHAKPVVDAFYQWCNEQCQRMELVPSEPLSKALNYARNREHSLRLYLSDPAIPIDTNHVERTLRVIPMGRKAWLFNWTEIGAEHIGNLQSLLTTCRLYDINPMDYLIDVLQRIDIHPASDIAQLTPRLWKQHFADAPLRSDLEL